MSAALMEQGIDTGINTITSICESFRLFLANYTDSTTTPTHILSDSTHTEYGRYVRQAQDMTRTQTKTLYINYQHLDPQDKQAGQADNDDNDDDISDSQLARNHRHSRRFFSLDQLEWFLNHYHVLEPHLCNTLRDFLSEIVPEYVPKDDTRSFSVSIFNFPRTLTVRQLHPEEVGKLVAFRAMATKSTKVSPEVSIGAFQCRDCHAIIKNVKQDFKITLPTLCVTPECTNKRFFDILPQYSTFTDWQQLTVQESTEQLPAGSVPRTVKIILRGELVEVAKPGDQCIVTGVLISIPDVAQLYSRTEHRTSDTRDIDNPRVRGLKDLGVREMSYKTAFLASNVTRISGTGATPYPDSLVAQLDGISDFQASNHLFLEEDIKSINAIKNKPNLAQVLINSVAPNVFGHDLVKKGILFMILGGVHKVTKDRTSLRGDINVLLIGDPSTAKSQFLKFVAEFMPRVVYTSGKASTAAGLTASVTRDSDTGEFVIEAGALMLADNGVCCIDEFDKMDQKDQSAIHEAMEQQTISIAKAGIQATLNARTSILAAANPINGHYDTTRTLKQNVNITPPIMSRFDLYFILIDQPNPDSDRSIAKHMIASHIQGIQRTRQTALGALASTDQAMLNSNIDRYLATVPTRQANHESIPADKLRAYIRYARQLDPQLSEEARELIVKTYADLRQRDLLGNTASSYKVTVRQLESLIRLSQACARMYLCTEVSEEHVREAAELLHKSIVSVKPSAGLVQLGMDIDDDVGDDDGDSDDDDNVPGSFPGGGGGGGGRKPPGKDDDDESDDHASDKKPNDEEDLFDDDKQDSFKVVQAIKRRRGETSSQVQSLGQSVSISNSAATKKQTPEEISTRLRQNNDILEQTRQLLANQEEDRESSTKKHAITSQEYNGVSLRVLYHLGEIRDDRVAEHLQLYCQIQGLDLAVIEPEIINNIQNQQFPIISPVELLKWLEQEDPLAGHTEVVFRQSWDKAVELDEQNSTTAATEHIANKKKKYAKKIYKLILRRMMNEDHSIISRADSIEIHPDYNIQHAVSDFGGMSRTAVAQRRREFAADETVYGDAAAQKKHLTQLEVDHRATSATLKKAELQTKSDQHELDLREAQDADEAEDAILALVSHKVITPQDDDADLFDDDDAGAIPQSPPTKTRVKRVSQQDSLTDDEIEQPIRSTRVVKSSQTQHEESTSQTTPKKRSTRRTKQQDDMDHIDSD